MEVRHQSPYATSLDAALDADGREVRVAVLKATFDMVDGHLEAAQDQEPVMHHDSFLGAPGASSIAYESDGALFKPGTDVVVTGAVFSPTGRALRQWDAALQVGQIHHRVLVTGNRRWSWGPVRASASAPEPFTAMPICWERCFGGADPTPHGAAGTAFEPRNPVGTGFRLSGTRQTMDGLALPNFEDPQAPMRSWSDKPIPTGLGFVGRAWAPRVRHAGTYDKAWERERSPVLPEDFDYRFFQAAPGGLALSGHLRGGEPIVLRNITQRPLDGFTVPRIRVTFSGFARGRLFKAPGQLDTVVVRSDSRQAILVWRLKYAVALDEAADSLRAEIEQLD